MEKTLKEFAETLEKKFLVEVNGLLNPTIDVEREQEILTRIATMAEILRYAPQRSCRFD